MFGGGAATAEKAAQEEQERLQFEKKVADLKAKITKAEKEKTRKEQGFQQQLQSTVSRNEADLASLVGVKEDERADALDAKEREWEQRAVALREEAAETQRQLQATIKTRHAEIGAKASELEEAAKQKEKDACEGNYRLGLVEGVLAEARRLKAEQEEATQDQMAQQVRNWKAALPTEDQPMILTALNSLARILAYAEDVPQRIIHVRTIQMDGGLESVQMLQESRDREVSEAACRLLGLFDQLAVCQGSSEQISLLVQQGCIARLASLLQGAPDSRTLMLAIQAANSLLTLTISHAAESSLYLDRHWRQR